MKRLVSIMLTVILFTSLAAPMASAEEKTGVRIS